jgi:hypothetical protein
MTSIENCNNLKLDKDSNLHNIVFSQLTSQLELKILHLFQRRRYITITLDACNTQGDRH